MANPATMLAARQGDTHAVAAWLDKGGGVDARSEEHDAGETLLMGAAAGGHEATVRMLLRHGASVNLRDSFGGTALIDAAFNGHTTTVQVLLNAKADCSLELDGSTALMMAEDYKHTETAQLLRQHAKRQAAAAEAEAMHATATAPMANLSGRRVRVSGLKGRRELNGRCGVVERFDVAKGRYEVAVEGEAEAMLLKPADLQDG